MDVDGDEIEECIWEQLGGPSVSFNCVTKLSKLKVYQRPGLIEHSKEVGLDHYIIYEATYHSMLTINR